MAKAQKGAFGTLRLVIVPLAFWPTVWTLMTGQDAGAPHFSERVDDELSVTCSRQSYDAETGLMTYEGPVRATYGPTIIESDRLVIDTIKHEGTAEGTVRLTDPEGSIIGNRIWFNWRDKTGRADQVEIVLGKTRMKASHIDIGQTEWVLENLWLTSCGERVPEIAFSARKVIARPGSRARIYVPGLELFGRRVITGPRLSLSLSPRHSGIRLPLPTFRRGNGFGLNWETAYAVSDSSVISGRLQSFPRTYPTSKLFYSISFLPKDEDNVAIEPRTELVERLSESHVDNITARDPYKEFRLLSEKRRNLAVGIVANEEALARQRDSRAVGKQFEGLVELGGPIGPFAGLGQFRYESIREAIRTPFRKRFEMNGTLHSGFWPLALGVQGYGRLDGFGTFGYGDRYGFVRGAAGVLFQPTKEFQADLAYARTTSAGNPMLGIDAPYSTHEFTARFDLFVGPITVSSIDKYDWNRRRWYDHETAVSLISGCFEPFVSVRQTPREYRIGLRFRVDDIAARLRRRDLTRKKPPEAPDPRGPRFERQRN